MPRHVRPFQPLATGLGRRGLPFFQPAAVAPVLLGASHVHATKHFVPAGLAGQSQGRCFWKRSQGPNDPTYWWINTGGLGALGWSQKITEEKPRRKMNDSESKQINLYNCLIVKILDTSSMLTWRHSALNKKWLTYPTENQRSPSCIFLPLAISNPSTHAKKSSITSTLAVTLTLA